MGVAVYMLVFLTALLFLFSSVAGFRSEKVFVLLSYAGFLVLAVSVFWLVGMDGYSMGIDSLTYMTHSADLVLEGKNPYRVSMKGAESLPGDPFITNRMDGSKVRTISYPALSFYSLVPQRALGIVDARLTLGVVTLSLILVMMWQSPYYLMSAPLMVVTVSRTFNPAVIGGSLWGFIWLFPLVLSMIYWRRDLRLSAVFLAASFAVKQIPWFIAPFLAVWLYRESDGLKEFYSDMRTMVLYGGGAFLLFNMPFVLVSPVAWLKGVLDPLFSQVPLAMKGRGLALLALRSRLEVSKSFFTFAMAGFTAVYLLAYYLYFERLKWTVWMAPVAILWFNYRFSLNYLVFFFPMVYMVIMRVYLGEGS